MLAISVSVSHAQELRKTAKNGVQRFHHLVYPAILVFSNQTSWQNLTGISLNKGAKHSYPYRFPFTTGGDGEEHEENHLEPDSCGIN